MTPAFVAACGAPSASSAARRSAAVRGTSGLGEHLLKQLGEVVELRLLGDSRGNVPRSRALRTSLGHGTASPFDELGRHAVDPLRVDRRHGHLRRPAVRVRDRVRGGLPFARSYDHSPPGGSASLETAPALVAGASAPLETTPSLVEGPSAPLETTPALVERPSAPLETTPSLVERPSAPLETTPSLVERPCAPFETTPALVEGPCAPLETTPALVEGPCAPLETTPALVEGPSAPLATTPALVEGPCAPLGTRPAPLAGASASLGTAPAPPARCQLSHRPRGRSRRRRCPRAPAWRFAGEDGGAPHASVGRPASPAEAPSQETRAIVPLSSTRYTEIPTGSPADMPDAPLAVLPRLPQLVPLQRPAPGVTT